MDSFNGDTFIGFQNQTLQESVTNLPTMKYKIQDIKRKYNGFLNIDSLKVTYDTFNGATITTEREIMERGDGVAVLLYEEETQSILFTKQFRIPCAERDTKAGFKDAGWLLELPAGSFGVDEEPLDAAKREVEEELGYHLNELQHVYTFYVSPGGCSERIFLFYAKVSESQKLSAGGGLESEKEDIQLVKIPVDNISVMLADGKIRDAKTMVGLMWWQMNYKLI